MDVKVPTNAQRSKYSSLLEGMHRQRHRVFAVDLGWSALASEDEIEIDTFDDEAAHYLVAHSGEEVHGSLRLLPAWRRSMIGECWPQAIQSAPPSFDQGVWEWTRWCPELVLRPLDLLASRRALILAATSFSLARGAHGFVTLCDLKFLDQIEALGWSPSRLGPPKRYAEGTAIAVGWSLSPSSLVETAARLSPARRIGSLRNARPVLAEAA